ncbi:MAG TPA: hypothetical protein PLL71_02335 [Agriterribacter sp.]|nr:hypothetical protein [Agriterribacter sp.]HRQ49952.1 hypothetical protein [Agriterribacter sp.]
MGSFITGSAQICFHSAFIGICTAYALHIFTRLRLWDESIQSNLASADAARCYAENLKMKDHTGAELHAMDYLVYACETSMTRCPNRRNSLRGASAGCRKIGR